MFSGLFHYTNECFYEILFIGLVAGVAATYSAITDLAVNKFTVPHVMLTHSEPVLDIDCCACTRY